MLSDCHMHTSFSLDSDASPEEMIEASIRKGLKHICITDHEDKDFVCEGELFVIDTDQYFQTLVPLKEKYKDQIDIGIGVEIGLLPHLGDAYHAYVKEYPFDFVIGSQHLVGGEDPYYKTMFQGRKDADVYRQALEETLQNIRVIPDFDVLGHMDYVVRYGTYQEKEYRYEDLKDLIDEILRYLIENGKGIELNTAGLKYGLPFAHPRMEILKRYRELGGEIITIGADAHKPEHIAYAFEKAEWILKEAGFTFYTEFYKRKPVFIQI